LGGVFAPSDFRTPPNVVAVASAPHGAVLPLARAVVAHGGHGTVMKALAHGLPLLCIPLGRDQPDNAVRVLESGAGLRLPPSRPRAPPGPPRPAGPSPPPWGGGPPPAPPPASPPRSRATSPPTAPSPSSRPSPRTTGERVRS